MPTTSQALAFAITATVLVVMPGPSVLFTIGRALTIGRRGALLTVLGNALGMVVQVVAVAFGLAALIETSAHVYTAVKLLGAAYLMFLGVQAIRHRRALVGADPKAPVLRTRRVLREGFVVGVTNPKMIVFFAAALPQFIDREAGHVSLQMLALGMIVPFVAVACDSTWAFVAGTARAWFARSERRVERMGVVGGVAMVGVGTALALSGGGAEP
jgi:threonine/homoserine/homoserine lactone efflux protein